MTGGQVTHRRIYLTIGPQVSHSGGAPAATVRAAAGVAG